MAPKVVEGRSVTCALLFCSALHVKLEGRVMVRAHLHTTQATSLRSAGRLLLLTLSHSHLLFGDHVTVCFLQPIHCTGGSGNALVAADRVHTAAARPHNAFDKAIARANRARSPAAMTARS